MIKHRIFGRDFIYRVRKHHRFFGIANLRLFKRIDFGKRSLYVSHNKTAFHNMQGIVTTKARDYVVHSTSVK